jgi:uncharacterized membrane protein
VSPLATSFWSDFRRFFLRGLATVLPALLTIVIIVWAFNFLNDKIGRRINGGIITVWVLAKGGGKAEKAALWNIWYQKQNWYLQAVGFVVAVIVVYLLGRFVASFVGRSMWRMIDRGMMRAPLVKQIYPSVKQVTDFLLSEKELAFSRVVAVEYPRKGVWSLGFVTGVGMRRLAQALGSELVTVFIPSSPTPVTGYTITVRREEVIDLPISMDEALRFTVSGGVLIPPAQRLKQSPQAARGTLPASEERIIAEEHVAGGTEAGGE